MVGLGIALYLVLCVVAGIVGRNRLLGFWGFFLLSLVLTPLLMIIALIVTLPRRSVAVGK